MVAPSLVLFAIFVFFPFAKNFQIPFYANEAGQRGFGNIQPKKVWVGFDEWREVLGGEEFRKTLWITVKFTLMTVPSGIVLGTLLAVAAHQKLRGIGVYRMIFSSTVATSAAVASVIFFSLFGPLGVAPWRIGGLPVLDNPDWVLPAVAIVAVWQSLGLAFIVMSAGLQGIPDDILEAAAIDGAGPVRRFWQVTLPLLSPTIFFAVVVGSITAFKTFAEVDLLTARGGPDGNARTLAWTIKDAAFDRTDQRPTAAVLSIGLFLVILVLTIAQLRLGERRVSYER
jgi:sn-glycerol 3-phosphate transport system permease protein